MRFSIKQCFAALAVFALVSPVWARPKSVDLEVTEPTTVGTTELQPGEYQFRANEGESQVTVFRNGKVIAQVPCHWVQLDSKPSQSEVLLSAHKVTELEFGGSTQAAQF